MKQYIKDNEGCLIEVTNLKEAIFQVALYLTYEIENPTGEQAMFHKKRLVYWKDIYTKLVLLKQEGEKTGNAHLKIVK
jgi:hypothetical protein